MKNLILLRGLPGAGKSTFAKTMWHDFVICEADDYFIDEYGEYKFDARDLPKAHSWCKRKVETYMQDNQANDLFYENIVVANTFTQEWEMKDYYELAAKYGYQVFSVIIENRHGNKSIHNVPDATMGNMLNRFEVKL